MGYRINEHKPKHPRRDVQGITSLSTVFIQNGTTFEYAIPCWYLIVEEPMRAHCHSRQHHDHVGWPSPTKQDHICQDWELAHSCHAHDSGCHHHDHCNRYLDMEKLKPIHLSDEGYTRVEIAFDDVPNGLVAIGYIDENRDWVIRVTVNAMVADAIDKRIKIPYTVFVSGEVMGHDRRDAVSHGTMVILPGPIGA